MAGQVIRGKCKYIGGISMLNLICTLVSKIVFLGLNGTSLILPIGILLYVLYGQVKDVKRVFIKVFRKEV